MADKKFKPTAKQGLYAAAGVVLVGSLAAAAITAPGVLNNSFEADKYSFNDARSNGNVAYNTSDSAGGGSQGSDDDEKNNKDSDKIKETEEHTGEADSPKQEEKKAPERQNPDPVGAKRDPEKSSGGSSNDASRNIGRDENGYALVNSNLTTDVAASYDSNASKVAENTDNLVDMVREEKRGTTPAPTAASPSAAPTARPRPTAAPATPTPARTPNAQPTQRPSEAAQRTAAPTPFVARGSGGSSGGGSEGGSATSAPGGDQSTPAPQTTPAPAPTAAPTPEITKAPDPTPAPTRAPLPTAEPDKSQQDTIEGGDKSGTEIEVTKGEVGVTNRKSGSGSSMSSGGATRIDFTRFTGDQSDVEYIQVSSSVRSINFATDKLLFPNLKGYVVAEGNKYYQSIDGVIYSKDGKILYACPAQLESIDTYPEGLETVYDGAFMGSQMKELSLPSTVKTVGKSAFGEAAMGTVTFEGKELTLGEKAFFNSDDGGLSVKKLVFKTTDPPEVKDNNALMFKNPHTGLETSGMVIEVPDTEGDTALIDYIEAWGETIDGIYGSGMTSYLFNTPSNAGKNYSFENNSLYRRLSAEAQPEATAAPEETTAPEGTSAPEETSMPEETSAPEETSTPEETAKPSDETPKTDGYKLLYAAPSTKGEYTPLFGTVAIASGAFKGCDGITSLNLPSTIEELEDGCFEGLDSLNSIVVSGAVPAKVGENVWKDIDPDEVSIYVLPSARDDYMDSWGKAIDEALGEGTAEKVIKAASEQYIYIDGALYAVHEGGNVLVDAPHTDLDNFKVDESAVSIAAGAFGSKYKYSYVLIPSTVKTIDKDAFRSTTIGTLVMTAEEPPELPEGIDVSAVDTVWVPEASLDRYKEKWGDKFSEILAPAANYASESHAIYGVNTDGTYELMNVPVVYSGNFTMLDMVREIRERAMADCIDVTGIDFSVVIDTVGKEAFMGNTSLKSVDMSRLTALRELPEKAFYGNTAMTDMKLPELLEVIGDYMAAENTSLETVNFNKLTKLRSIGKYAFYNDTSLTQASLSTASSLREIGEGAFENATSLTTVRLPLNLTVLSDKLFKNASSLSRISFVSTLKEIGNETLYGTAIETLNFSYYEDLEKVGERAFAHNEAAKSLTVPDKLTMISAGLAEGNSALEKVSLSPDTTEIGDEAFKDCVSLESIDLPAALKKLGERVFEGCTSLTRVVVRAETPPEAGADAFGSKFENLKIYVPDDSYDSYVSAWDELLYNKAAVIIQKLSGSGSTDPERTPTPTEPPVPTVKPIVPTLPPLKPDAPNATQEPETTQVPDATQAPETTQEPEATQEPQNGQTSSGKASEPLMQSAADFDERQDESESVQDVQLQEDTGEKETSDNKEKKEPEPTPEKEPVTDKKQPEPAIEPAVTPEGEDEE